MKVNRRELLEAVKAAGKLTGGHSNFAILQGVLLDGKNQRLEATDLESSLMYPLEITDYVRENVPEEIPEEFRIENNLSDLKLAQLKQLAEDYGIEVPGKATLPKYREAILEACENAEVKAGTWTERFCLPCAELKKILETLEEETLDIVPVPGEDGLFPSVPRVRIGENFHGLGQFAPEEFPLFVEEDTLSFPTSVKVPRKDLENVAMAGSTDSNQGFNLSVVHFNLEDRKMVATDGHRLHMATLDDVTVAEGVKSLEFPLDAVKMAKLCGENIVIYYDHEHGKIMMPMPNGGKIYARAYEFSFPDYKMVMPNREQQKTVTLDKKSFEKPLSQAMTISNSNYAAMKLKFNGGIDMEFNNPERGGYQKVSIPITGKNYGEEEVAVGLNMRFLRDAMRPVDSEKLEIRFSDSNKPIVMGHENFTALVMPTRV